MNKLAVITLSAVALAAAVPAMAQETKPIGLAVKAGLFFPSDATAKTAGKNWFAFGVDYKLKDLNVGMGKSSGSLSLSLDYLNKGGFRSVPVLVNYTLRSSEFYYGVGAGVSFTRIPGLSDKTRFAFAATLGYEFQTGKTPLFIEARYLGTEKKELGGFGVFVGVRL
jgi:hypothetical protein